MNETIVTVPAGDVGHLHVTRTQPDSPNRFEVWQTYGGRQVQVGWLIKSRNRYDLVTIDETHRHARANSLADVLEVGKHGIATDARRDRQRAERIEAEAAERAALR